MLLRKPPAERLNVLPVRIVEQIFRGATDQLLLRTPDGLELHAAADGGDWKRDDIAFAQIDPRDIILIPGSHSN